MANHVPGTSTPRPVLPYCLGELRQLVLGSLLGNPLFSEAEQLRANHAVHECQDSARLTHWLTTVRAELARRQATAHRRGLASPDLRSHCTCPPRLAPTWGPGAPLPDRADYPTSSFDCQATARPMPPLALTVATLFPVLRP